VRYTHNKLKAILSLTSRLHDRPAGVYRSAALSHRTVVRHDQCFLAFKTKHEVMIKAFLHHHSVNSAGQVNVSCQEYNTFSFTCVQSHQHIADCRNQLLSCYIAYTAIFDFGLTTNFSKTTSVHAVPKWSC